VGRLECLAGSLPPDRAAGSPRHGLSGGASGFGSVRSSPNAVRKFGQVLVPEGLPTIAQRCSVGSNVRSEHVLKGRLRRFAFSAVPSGLRHSGRPNPTLKRWAIVGSPSGTTTWRQHGSNFRTALGL
jgi:hypothetical protein